MPHPVQVLGRDPDLGLAQHLLPVGAGVMRQAVLRLVVLLPVDLRLLGLGVRVEVMHPVGRVVLHLVDLRLRGPGVRVGVMRRVGRVVLRLVDLRPVDPAVPDLTGGRVRPGSRAVPLATGPMAPAVQTDLAVQTVPVHPVGPTSPAGQASLVHPASLAVPTTPVSRVGMADLHRRPLRRTSSTVSTTNPAPRWAARGICRMGSARPTTVRRLRPVSTDSVGRVGRPPELRRHSGTAHRLLAAGTGRRLPVVGTLDGMGHPATSCSRSRITGRLPTTVTAPSRSSTRSSGDGASGSSVSGCRCTDLTRD
jgi:hypothetical protein